jgi:uncharacterized membrane protein
MIPVSHAQTCRLVDRKLALQDEQRRQGVGMGKGRLEAFSDGVIAIIITVMVLEMKVPHGEALAALRELIPVFVSDVLSLIYIGT